MLLRAVPKLQQRPASMLLQQLREPLQLVARVLAGRQMSAASAGARAAERATRIARNCILIEFGWWR